MPPLRYLTSVIPMVFFVGTAQAGDKEDIIAAQGALIAAWNSNEENGR